MRWYEINNWFNELIMGTSKEVYYNKQSKDAIEFEKAYDFFKNEAKLERIEKNNSDIVSIICKETQLDKMFRGENNVK